MPDDVVSIENPSVFLFSSFFLKESHLLDSILPHAVEMERFRSLSPVFLKPKNPKHLPFNQRANASGSFLGTGTSNQEINLRS